MLTITRDTALPTTLLERLSRSHITFVDVGASGGVQPPWQQIESCLDVIAFEPDPDSFSALQQAGHPASRRSLNMALSDHRGRATLHVTRRPGGSSLITPNADFLRQFRNGGALEEVRTLECDVDTLDAQLGAAGVSDVDFIKLDTQGTEHLVLKGAPATLGRAVFGVEVEVEFNALYEEQPLFADVDALLRAAGFELGELSAYWWPRWSSPGLDAVGRGQPMWGEAVYFRGGRHLAATVWPRQGSTLDTYLTRCVVICLIYGCAPYALALVDAAAQAGPLEADTADRLRTEIHAFDRAVAVHGVGYLLALTPEQASAARKLHKRDGLDLAAQLRSAIGIDDVKTRPTRVKPILLPAELSEPQDDDFVRIDLGDDAVCDRLAAVIDDVRDRAFALALPIALGPQAEALPRLGDVDADLRAAGYEIFDFDLQRLPRNPSDGLVALGLGQPAAARLLYLRGLRYMQSRWRLLDSLWIEPEVARVIAICLRCGRGDYALDLVDLASSRLTYDAASAFRRAIRRYDVDAGRRGYGYVRPDVPVIGSGDPTVYLTLSGNDVRRVVQSQRDTGRPIDRQVVDAIDRWLVDRGVVKASKAR